MKCTWPWTMVVSFGLASSSWAQWPPPVEGYTFRTIDPPGSTDTIARAVNFKGDVVGQYLDAGGVSHGFLLRRGGFRRIDFPGASNSRATGINALNDIVGVYTGGHGFLLREGRFTTLDFGRFGTSPRAINDAGDVIGDYRDSNGIYHSFLLRGGAFTPIDFPGADGEFGTVAYGMNSGGVIVGTYTSLLEGTGGFVLEGGLFGTLLFPDAYITRAFSINAAGWIVGDYFDANGWRHAFLATK